MRLPTLLPFLLVGLLLAGCTAAAADDDLGEVDFRVSCAPEVQEDFDRAVAHLHHMMYEQARSEFAEIAERDRECAMAHWGIAMTLFQPLWPGRPAAEDRRRGWEAVERARELGPETERERALLDAVHAFWEDPESDEWWPRIERWAEAMESAYQEHGEDLDVAAFYSLSLLAAGQTADDQLAYNARAAGIAAEVHEREPLHPGAIHYTIHADDATGRASEHLDVVGTYGEIAPSVPHALHMPSHVYVRLGDWPAVIEWNRRSAEAALDYPVNGNVSVLHVHGLDYKLYGFLQRGDDARAEEVLEEALSTEPYEEDFTSAFHLAIMPARYAIERRDWEAAANLVRGEPGYLDWDRYEWPQAIAWFAPGLGAVMTGDVEAAREAEARMAQLRDRSLEAGEQAYATYIEVDRLILAGRIAWAEGDEEEAVALTEEAAQLEGTVEKHPVTPGALLPPYEALGDLLLDLEHPDEALAAYESGLEVWPKRYRSLLGAARAAEAAGEEERAREHYGVLREVAAEESERGGVREAGEAPGES